MNRDNEVKKAVRTDVDAVLENAVSVITKDYLEVLDTLEIKKPTIQDTDIDIIKCAKFFRLSKLVINKEEKFLDKLTTIVNVVYSINSSLTTVIRSDGRKVEYYFGIIAKNIRGDRFNRTNAREAIFETFSGAVSGNLIGSELKEVSKEELAEFKSTVFENENNCYSSVSGIVALRSEEEKTIEGYVQGIENLVDSLKGKKYTIIMIADPLKPGDIHIQKKGYEILHTQLSVFQSKSVTANESESVSASDTQTDTFTNSITQGITMTQSTTNTVGSFSGMNTGIGLNLPLFKKFAPSVNLGANKGKSKSESLSNSDAKSYSTCKSDSFSSAHSDTLTSERGLSTQITLENRSVKSLRDKIDKYLERLDMCENFGAFNCATYVITDTKEKSLSVASNYNALMRGDSSFIQSSYINTWADSDKTELIGEYLSCFVHPKFNLGNDHSGFEKIVVTPASVISGDELAIQIGLPKKSINGVTVIPMAPFGRNVVNKDKTSTFELGKLYHMGHADGGEFSQSVNVDIESLSMHTFITGSTGSGKSTAIYSVLDKLREKSVKNSPDKKIKFLVVEPAKGEYKTRFGNDADVSVYGTNSKKMPVLRINPFSFPEDIHVLEHIDRLIEIFNVCWPMYAAMPAVLKDAIERAYISAGWDLEESECRFHDSYGNCMYPTFGDVLNQVNLVMNESEYSSDSKGDYKGALCTRIKSLTNGIYGKIFTCDEISPEKLFNENVIIDLSRVGSQETKSLLMGIIVLKLQEFRMSEKCAANSPLRHVTVLEEAHHLLKRTSSEQSSENSNLSGKSVEMLANSIAEMRTYGEGFIIADQSPGLMDMSVIRNTNTKIILRLPDYSDRELVGRAANLNDEQVEEISRLETFVAAIYQNNWLEPVLCKIDVYFKDNAEYLYQPLSDQKSLNKKRYIIKYLVDIISNETLPDKSKIDELNDAVFRISITAESKKRFLEMNKTTNGDEKKNLAGRVLYDILDAEKVIRNRKGNSCKTVDQLIAMHRELKLYEYTNSKVKEMLVIGMIYSVHSQYIDDSVENWSIVKEIKNTLKGVVKH